MVISLFFLVMALKKLRWVFLPPPSRQRCLVTTVNIIIITYHGEFEWLFTIFFAFFAINQIILPFSAYWCRTASLNRLDTLFTSKTLLLLNIILKKNTFYGIKLPVEKKIKKGNCNLLYQKNEGRIFFIPGALRCQCP